MKKLAYRVLAEKKERERIKQERLKAKKKSPCEKIKDDKTLLNDAIRTSKFIVIPTSIKDGYIKYKIQQEGNSALCFYKERTRR